MTEEPGEQLEEEPQAERGAVGSRDEGDPEPGGGPVDRPGGTTEEESDTGVDEQSAQHDGAPDLQGGGG